jgi:hypothetical protein
MAAGEPTDDNGQLPGLPSKKHAIANRNFLAGSELQSICQVSTMSRITFFDFSMRSGRPDQPFHSDAD